MTVGRAAAWVLVLAVAAYTNSLGNGFAYDDDVVIVTNPVVTEADWGEALGGPYWQTSTDQGMLYRPVTVAFLAIQWLLWDGAPRGFHVVNVALHGTVSVLVLLLLARFAPVVGAAFGAAVFAVHPVHVEAVANVVGVAELLAALFVLLACLLYLKEPPPGWRRGVRVGGLVALYLLGISAKEIAVTLPGLLLLLELGRAPRSPGADASEAVETPRISRRLLGEAPTLVALAVALLAYSAVRIDVLGSVTGELAAPALVGLEAGPRVLTAITVWPHYLRLLLFPVALSADYAPAVLTIVTGVTPEVVAGLLGATAVVAAAALAVRRRPAVALGIGWVAVALLPVSNLFFSVGTLLAERTLYLPSVGLAFVLAALVPETLEALRTRRVLGALAALLVALLAIRTAVRNPVWLSSFTVAESVNRDHPESFFAQWRRAEGLARVGETEEARSVFETAVALAPRHYGLLCRVADFVYREGDPARARSLLMRAREVMPRQHSAYRLLAGQLIEAGPAREGHRVALEGLALAGPDRQLWALVSESYIVKGDLEAAVRARQAALGLDPSSQGDWTRLAELLEALGHHEQARAAARRAGALAASAARVPGA